MAKSLRKQIRELEDQLDAHVIYAESRRKGSKLREKHLSYAEQLREISH